jgi:phage-related protein
MKLNKEQILSIVRQILTTTGAILVTAGVMQDGMHTELIGTIMTLISGVWSVVDKTDANIVKKFDNIQAKQKK